MRSITDDQSSDSLSDDSNDVVRSPIKSRNRKDIKQKSNVAEADDVPASGSRPPNKRFAGGDGSNSANANLRRGTGLYPIESATQFPASSEWVYVRVPRNHPSADTSNAFGGLSDLRFAGGWPYIPPNSSQVFRGVDDAGSAGINRDPPSKSSSIKEESLKRRERRTKKREAEEEARKREEKGLKPYVVQVRSSGIVDSGCRGHLKWQELVRDLTPRMLNMGIFKYEDQSESSKNLLRDALMNKFEFVDHVVTKVGFDRMIKTWMRKERERLKRTHGHQIKPPGNYSEQEWEAMKGNWDSPASKIQSEKMSETRKKVTSNPRVGRQGYAGKREKLVRLLA